MYLLIMTNASLCIKKIMGRGKIRESWESIFKIFGENPFIDFNKRRLINWKDYNVNGLLEK